MPRVSVLLPVRNGGLFLEEAIRSVLMQTFKDFELLIYDDGSTDQTSQVISEFVSADSRTMLVGGETVGITKALNHLAACASGSILARMDADDICTTKRFEAQVKHLDDNSNCIAVGGQIESIDNHGNSRGTSNYPLDHRGIHSAHLKGITQMAHPSTMFRKDAFEKVGGYDESLRYSQDLDLWLKLGEIGELNNLERNMLQYRTHQSSISTEKRSDQWKFARMAVEKAFQRNAHGQQQEINLSELYRQHAGFERREANKPMAQRLAWHAFKLNPSNPMTWYSVIRMRF